MVTTTNKGYALIVTGTEVDTWGDLLNSDVFTIVDRNLGGLVSKSLTNVNVTLTAEESEALMLVLDGTLTGAVQITTAAVGVTIIDNGTSGAFNVTFTNGVGTPVTLTQGERSIVITDATNGPRVAARSSEALPSGTRAIFQQTTAPTGWTKDATHDNKALRIVSGSASSGGSVDFTTAFASQGVAGSVGSTALSEANLPEHTHFVLANVQNTGGNSGLVDATEQVEMKHNYGNSNTYSLEGTATAATVGKSSSVGSGTGHTHAFTGTAINLAVAYVDFIIAQRD